MDISKRQVVRPLTSDLDGFVAEDQAILRSGLATAPYISVDDTGARHAHRDGIGVKGLTGCIPFLPELVAVRPA